MFKFVWGVGGVELVSSVLAVRRFFPPRGLNELLTVITGLSDERVLTAQYVTLAKWPSSR